MPISATRPAGFAGRFRAVIARELRPTLRLAVPLALAELGWMAMGIVDSLMVGRLPRSAVALGAVSLGSTLYHTVAIFANGLLLGLDTTVAQAFGRGDHDDARTSLRTGIVLALALSAPVMLAASLAPAVVRRAGVAPEIVAAMAPFLRALNWGTPPLLFYFALRRYLQAVNIVAPVTFAYISANAVNAFFNWVFIFGHLGSPAMGVSGSGWSTCVARIYMAAVLAAAAWKAARAAPYSKAPAVDWVRVRRLLGLGLPAAMQILMEIGVFATVGTLIGKLGAVPLAAHQIAINCAAFTYMVPLGISSAAAVRVGNALGRGDSEGARDSGWMAILLGAGFMAAAGVFLAAMPRVIARAFTGDGAVISAAATLLMIAAAFQLFDGLQTVATGALRGAGNTRTPMIANLAAYWLIGLPVGCVLGFKLRWGAAGLWAGLCVGLILLGTGLLAAWHRTSALRNCRTAELPN
ncbi:MAG: MATE family efflux transporter [Acidobacteria bacterium]|nr:MATE family efflux transporter [Acidobacteriota bacterium]